MEFFMTEYRKCNGCGQLVSVGTSLCSPCELLKIEKEKQNKLDTQEYLAGNTWHTNPVVSILLMPLFCWGIGKFLNYLNNWTSASYWGLGVGFLLSIILLRKLLLDKGAKVAWYIIIGILLISIAFFGWLSFYIKW